MGAGVGFESGVGRMGRDSGFVTSDSGAAEQPACAMHIRALPLSRLLCSGCSSLPPSLPSLLPFQSGSDFEVVNVLDEQYNPGLRDTIKAYSQWPTIPQLYVGGEFVGGADIVEEMHGSGELRSLLQQQAK